MRCSWQPISSLARLQLAASSRSVRCCASMGKYTYDYPRPAVTVDAVIVAQSKPAQVLLIKRKNPPFKDAWALPGGFVDENESLDTAAARELKEETSVEPSSALLKQVGAFGAPRRDPRGWTITIAYAALVPSTSLGVKAADDAVDAQWFEVGGLPTVPLAFDHKLVVRTALRSLASDPAAAAVDGLVEQLQTAADNLEGKAEEEAESNKA